MNKNNKQKPQSELDKLKNSVSFVIEVLNKEHKYTSNEAGKCALHALKLDTSSKEFQEARIKALEYNAQSAAYAHAVGVIIRQTCACPNLANIV